MTWVERLARYCPITALSQELVRFDTQLMQNAEIAGVAYQQGALAGYEVREYLLEKWHRTCAYCGAQEVPLEVEHIIPKGRGGSNRVSAISRWPVVPCNQKKGPQTAAEFGFPQVQAQAKLPLKDAAAVNATRWALYHAPHHGLPVETTGGRTKYNRTRLGIAKSHWGDAACVGASTPAHLDAQACSRSVSGPWGTEHRQMCRTDAHGFPKSPPCPAEAATSGCRRAISSKLLCPRASIAAPGSAASSSRRVGGLISSSMARKPACTRNIVHGCGRRMAIRTPCLLSQAPPFPPPAQARGLHGGILRSCIHGDPLPALSGGPWGGGRRG